MKLHLLVCLAFVATARADISFSSSLDGVQAGTGSLGTGSASIFLHENVLGDLNDDTLDFSITFGSLGSGWTLAHFHGPAAPGFTAGVVFDIPSNSSVSPSTGVTSGIFQGSNRPISATAVGYLKDGLTYLNIHTTNFPAGEIRGQVVPVAVPEPGTFGLLAMGACALLRLSRPRKA